MQTEHRCCARKALDREIMIGSPQAGYVRARVRDVSLGGMGIETAGALVLNTPVELLFHTSAGTIEEIHRWQATVKHATPDGAGLEYAPFVLTELSALLGLLQEAERQSLQLTEERTGLRFRNGLRRRRCRDSIATPEQVVIGADRS